MPEDMHGDCDLKLSLYLHKPSFSFDLEELIEITKHRYNLLKLISESSGENASKWIEAVVDRLCSEQVGFLYPLVTNQVEGSAEELSRKDWVSHYSLRLACARYYESLKWFIRQEVKLVHFRWHHLSRDDRHHFLAAYSIHPQQVSEDERKELREAFSADEWLSSEALYKVHFSNVSDLLRKRTVLLRNGWAYLRHEDLIHPVAVYLSKYLNTSLRTAKKRYDFAVYDKRLTPFFRRISDDIRFTFFKFSLSSHGSVKISDLSKLSKESYPLCMEMLHHTLLKEKHLRNGGRFQYNLFLKGIGLSLVDAVKFWSDVFTKKMSFSAFKRGYLYHIRHGYGKLGKNADYPPLSCSKILESVPGPVDHHGCPFNIPHRDIIAANLTRHKVSEQGVEEIWRLVEEGRPQQACGRLFELKHGVTDQPATQHPNSYYIHSRNLLAKPNPPESAAADTSVKCISNSCCSKALDW